MVKSTNYSLAEGLSSVYPSINVGWLIPDQNPGSAASVSTQMHSAVTYLHTDSHTRLKIKLYKSKKIHGSEILYRY